MLSICRLKTTRNSHCTPTPTIRMSTEFLAENQRYKYTLPIFTSFSLVPIHRWPTREQADQPANRQANLAPSALDMYE